MPRFIIDLRELYDRDRCARWQGIDTGFGVLSQSGATENTLVSTIVFADVAARESQITEETNESGGIQLKVLGDGRCQV